MITFSLEQNTFDHGRYSEDLRGKIIRKNIIISDKGMKMKNVLF